MQHEPIHAWHEEVEDDDIGTPVVDDLQCLLPIRCRNDLIGLAFEELTDQVHNLWVIIHHQETSLSWRDMGQCGQDRVAIEGFDQVVTGP